jgi:hypothetical protein
MVLTLRSGPSVQGPGQQQLKAVAAATLLLLVLIYFQQPLHTKQGSGGISTAGSRLKYLQLSPAELAQQDRAYESWLSGFKAADPAYQDYCMAVLVNSTTFKDKGGQASQDIFLFRNLFKFWPQEGRKGFYVEAGANDPLYLSNTLFFDKCLGWDGLCVEPQAQFHKVGCRHPSAGSWMACSACICCGKMSMWECCYNARVHCHSCISNATKSLTPCPSHHRFQAALTCPVCGFPAACVAIPAPCLQALKEKRSCTLVPECISATKEVLSVVETSSAATARVAPAGPGTGSKVNCAPLSDLLARYAGSAHKQVDILILDVEGYEMKILEATQFANVSVEAVMVEDLLMLPKPDVLDMLMSQQGFLKFQELALDSVFVRRGHPAALATTRSMWYPPGFTEEVEEKIKFVRSNLCSFLRQYWGLLPNLPTAAAAVGRSANTG